MFRILQAKNRRCPLLLLPLLLMSASAAFGQTTTFTYQGRLTDGGTAANGNYDFQFGLFDTNTVGTGTQQGSAVIVSNVLVTSGVFVVQLDFGAGVFSGANRFLEIAVKQTSAGAFTTLGPRQPLTSTPYSIRSLNATTADGLSVACVSCITSSQIESVAGSAVSGTIPLASVPAGSTNYIQNATSQQSASNFNISGSGTAGGTLSSNIVNATTQYNIGGNRVLSNGAGANNLFAGVAAGQSNSTGFDNAFFGRAAGFGNTTGFGNSFFGFIAGQSNSTGFGNSFFGESVGMANTSGANNSFFGAGAAFSNTTGVSNSFFGASAGQSNTTASNNSFFGFGAGLGNTTGFNNAFFGKSAGQSNTTGESNSFFGQNAGFNNKAEIDNTFIGNRAGFSNGLNDPTNLAGFNTFVGSFAGNGNTTGRVNSFFGANAGLNNTSGTFNSFFGQNAGLNNTISANNSFFGASAGLSNTTGGGNSFFGEVAGVNTTTGVSNSFFGQDAGQFNTTGGSNSIFGHNANVGFMNLTNATAIGANARVDASNSLVLGSIAGVNGATTETNVGIGTTAPTEKLTVKTATGRYGFIHSDGTITVGSFVGGSTGGGWYGTKSNHSLSFFVNDGGPSMQIDTAGMVHIVTLGTSGSTPLCRNASNQISTCSSSLRYKTAVRPFLSGLEIINRLRPITFTWKQDGTRDLGLGAEDVAAVEPLLVIRNEKGEVEGVKYDHLNVVLVNSIKEQQEEIKQQREQNARQQKQLTQQQQQIESLRRLICQHHPNTEVCR